MSEDQEEITEASGRVITVDRHTALRQAAEMKAVITAFLNNNPTTFTKGQIQGQLIERLREIVGDRIDSLQGMYDSVLYRMARDHLIQRIDTEDHVPLFASIEYQADTKRPRKAESDQAKLNRISGQQARSLRERKLEGETLLPAEEEFLRLHGEGKMPPPMQNFRYRDGSKAKKQQQSQPKKPKQGELALTKPKTPMSVPAEAKPVHPQLQQTAWQQSQHHPQAAHYQPASPEGMDVQIFTPGGSVVKTSANSPDQLDALFASIKKHGL